MSFKRNEDIPMLYRYSGNSGIQLPVLSLGLWHNFGSVDDFSTATEMVVRAFDKGICHFDLANNYGPEPGSAETNFGRILRNQLAYHRDEIFVSSKAGHDMWPGVATTAAKTSLPAATRVSSEQAWITSMSSIATATMVSLP